jgi:hypothetical protein
MKYRRHAQKGPRYRRYVEEDPKNMYEVMSLGILHSFFDLLLNQKRTGDGRLTRGIRYMSTLGTYWKIYRLAYERATGQKISVR